MADIAQVLNQAKACHQAGQLGQAESLYRQALAADASNAEVLYLLGATCHALGKGGEAVGLLEQAVRLLPNHADLRHHLGVVLIQQDRLNEAIANLQEAWRLKPQSAEIGQHLREALAASRTSLALALGEQGRWDAAIGYYREALELQPNSVAVLGNLGNALKHQAKLDEAAACYRRVLEIAPDSALAYNDLGLIAQAQGRLDEAVTHYRRALALQNGFAEAYSNLGTALSAQGKNDEAETCCRRAVAIKPDYAEAHYDLGNVLTKQGKLDEALACFERAVRLNPNSAEIHFRRAEVFRLKRMQLAAIASYQESLRIDPSSVAAYKYLAYSYVAVGQPDLAAQCCRKALELEPNSVELYDTLASALHNQGRLDEMVAAFRKAIELDPGSAEPHGHLLYALNYVSGIDPGELLAEHRLWASRHAEPLTTLAPAHTNDRTPDRRLRIGYVSAHFFRHAVRFFSEPILMSHDHANFEIFCYSDLLAGDDVTARFKATADHWRDVDGMSDEALAQTVRDDRIDILVDLAGHIGGNRLLAFARKPAPIQVTYIGYQNTTGMTAMDYRLTDERADPPGATDAFYTEQLVRLPGSFFCYRPADEAPPIGPLPATAAGRVTFGSFNNFNKITPRVITTWLEILKRVSDSHLLVLAAPGGYAERLLKQLAEEHGVDPRRVTVEAMRPVKDYLRLVQQADIALDSFPFNGHTTTCDSIWMGVPVVMLEGDTYASRFGGSVLANVGLENLIARTVDEYVEKAVELASELDRLAQMRAELRPRMAASVLLDFKGFTRNLEAAYRQMWHKWCSQGTDEPPAAEATRSFG